MQPAEKIPARPSGRLYRARALYRNVSKRQVAWLLLKDTVNSCVEYRIIGLAAEAAFFVLLSLPPLLLSLVGALGYLDSVIGTDSVDNIRQNILTAASTVMSPQGMKQLVRPLVDDVFGGGRPDLISIGFVIAVWSGSRAVDVFIDTITIMYGLEGRRGLVKTRLLAFLLFVVALVIGAFVLPLMVAGPDAVIALLPRSEGVIRVLYWPVVLLLSIVFLTTLYDVSVPVRSPWYEDVPGALVALQMWLLGSLILRFYLSRVVEGPTIYGSLAAPVAVLLWIGVSAFAVLVGAAVNAAVDRVWPSIETAAARAENIRAREEEAAEVLARAAERRALEAPSDDEIGVEEPPAEFPERWAGFHPPGDIRSRLRPRRTPPQARTPEPASVQKSEPPAGRRD